MLRGLFSEKNYQKPNSFKYSIKGIDAMLSFSDKRMMPEISSEILEQYNESSVEAFPFHTCLFTNEFFKEKFKEMLKEFEGIETEIKQRFIQDEDFASFFYEKSWFF